jgi:hypothetical protein
MEADESEEEMKRVFPNNNGSHRQNFSTDGKSTLSRGCRGGSMTRDENKLFPKEVGQSMLPEMAVRFIMNEFNQG